MYYDDAKTIEMRRKLGKARNKRRFFYKTYQVKISKKKIYLVPIYFGRGNKISFGDEWVISNRKEKIPQQKNNLTQLSKREKQYEYVNFAIHVHLQGLFHGISLLRTAGNVDIPVLGYAKHFIGCGGVEDAAFERIQIPKSSWKKVKEFVAERNA
jgi:hypothetical protein